MICFVCTSIEWISANGICITKEYVCDSRPDCRDESDENYELCGKNRTQSEKTNQILLELGVCGTTSTNFISYGQKSKLLEYPWMALILHTYGN